jgi:NADH-quinone oxidoreductase subunit J
MNGPLAWIAAETSWWNSPFSWALILGVAGMWIRLSGRAKPVRLAGGVLAVASLVLLAIASRWMGGWSEQIVFWMLAGVTLFAAGMAISSHSPVYMAIWFALSLLGTAGLFLFMGAQFLGAATIVVYAGAIVVTFLFVLMLAQPRGSAAYDHVSWAHFPVPISLIAGAIVLGMLVAALPAGTDTSQGPDSRSGNQSIIGEQDHMARLGGELFARHLVSVEIAGTLLLVALVGAIAIVLHGKTPVPPSRDLGRSGGERVSVPPSNRLAGGSDE